MQVVSGAVGHENVHFEAPAADKIPKEMNAFLHWFQSENEIDPVLKAGISHFWFVTIHLFEDGNRRIARAIGDLALARAISAAETILASVIFKANFWKIVNENPVNQRQQLTLNAMLSVNFKGRMNTSKYAKIAKCSHDTALRDIQNLKKRKIFIQNPGNGRSTSYQTAWKRLISFK